MHTINFQQRTIKFRAWDGEHMIHDIGIRSGMALHLDTGKMHDWPLMQYTGLNDKDGQEIYEGDIIRRWAEDWAESVSRGMAADRWDFLISFNGPFIGCVGTNANVHNPIDMEWSAIEFKDGANALDDCTVIGNIYENPELTKL
jgi:uncharacterized phage protein (TIGR01671 family)